MLESLGNKLPRNYFDLGQEHCFTAKAGFIYPVFQMLLMPGDYIEVENAALVRQLPTISPSLSKFKIKFWDVVVAIRNLDKTFYNFLSGHEEYTTEEAWTEPLPRWNPSNIEKTRPGTLWDFLENPTSVIPDEEGLQLDYYRQAYGYIWDIYFRNETRQESILVKGEPGSWKGEDLLRVNWDKDYLTTSVPRQQLGDPLAIPITGIGSAVWNADDFKAGVFRIDGNSENWTYMTHNQSSSVGERYGTGIITGGRDGATWTQQDAESGKNTLIHNILNNNKIDFGTAGSIYLSTIREAIAHQSINEINAMAGIRPNEFLEAHWGERPSDEALQYPEIFGKSEMELITSEVVQTSESTNTSPLGNLGGHGIVSGRGGRKKFYSKEFSIYLKLMYIKPNTIYGGQQAKREYTQKSIYDFPFPELNHISMQPIFGREVLCASTKTIYSDDNGKTLKEGGGDDIAKNYNKSILGYDTNFSWFREKLPRVSGLLKQEQYKTANDRNADIGYNDNLYHWTEARFFKDKEGERPHINSDFLEVKLDNRNYKIVDETIQADQFIIRHFNKVDAWRTLSKKGLPSSLGMF